MAYRSTIAICLLLMLSLLGLTVPPIGLASNGAFQCQDLHSSGSDDEVAFSFLALLLLPALMRGLRFHAPISWLESAFVSALVAMAAFLALEVSDCADWIVTARVTGNLHLIAVLGLMPLVVMIYLLPNRRLAA